MSHGEASCWHPLHLLGVHRRCYLLMMKTQPMNRHYPPQIADAQCLASPHQRPSDPSP